MSPTQEWINEKKKVHGKVFKSTVGGDVFYFRALRRKEHLDIQKEVFPEGVPTDGAPVNPDSNAKVENAIVEKCVLWPETTKIEDLSAGAPPTLVAMILQYSGFGMATEPEEV